MAEADRVRIEIGFDGGQIMSELVEAAAVDQLERTLAGGEDVTFAFDTTDGHTIVALRRVLYVKRFARESRVGFGSK